MTWQKFHACAPGVFSGAAAAIVAVTIATKLPLMGYVLAVAGVMAGALGGYFLGQRG